MYWRPFRVEVEPKNLLFSFKGPYETLRSPVLSQYSNFTNIYVELYSFNLSTLFRTPLYIQYLYLVVRSTTEYKYWLMTYVRTTDSFSLLIGFFMFVFRLGLSCGHQSCREKSTSSSNLDISLLCCSFVHRFANIPIPSHHDTTLYSSSSSSSSSSSRLDYNFSFLAPTGYSVVPSTP